MNILCQGETERMITLYQSQLGADDPLPYCNSWGTILAQQRPLVIKKDGTL